jgi:hypothetical protein
VSRLAQSDPGLGEGVDKAVRGLFEERPQSGGDRPVPEEGETGAAPLAQGEQLSLAGVCEAVGAADDEMPDVVGEYPGGDRVPGGALGVGPGSVCLAALGESFAQGVEEVVGEGGGCSVGGAGVDGQTSHSRVVRGMRGGCPVGVIVFVGDDGDRGRVAGGHYMPPILL